MRFDKAGVLTVLCLGLVVGGSRVAQADPAEQLERDSRAALESLVSTNDAAKLVAEKAAAVLVFPTIVKGGFLFGGQIGDGVLFKKGKLAGYYNSVAASYGLQAGLQEFGYALFFMNEKALAYLHRSEGFELGTGPSMVIVDQGFAKTLSSTTLTQDVYAFTFNQEGLMGGVGIQGTKITKIDVK